MKLRNDFVVAAPLDRTWSTLLDVPRVASALPGAELEPGGVDGGYRGRMKVRVGPVTVEYAGTARLEEVDEDARVAAFHVQGSGGQGTAAATIVTRVSPAEGGTRVVVETDLRVTGRAASFGRGLMEDVASRLLDEFARLLEDEIAGRAVEPAAEALDVGRAVWAPLRIPALAALVGLAAGYALGRRRA